MPYLLIALAILNLTTLFAYGLDKSYARRKHRRISEKTLLLLALCGGSVGALVGMCAFRHKTRKIVFTLGVPLMLALQLFLLFVLVF